MTQEEFENDVFPVIIQCWPYIEKNLTDEEKSSWWRVLYLHTVYDALDAIRYWKDNQSTVPKPSQIKARMHADAPTSTLSPEGQLDSVEMMRRQPGLEHVRDGTRIDVLVAYWEAVKDGYLRIYAPDPIPADFDLHTIPIVRHIDNTIAKILQTGEELTTLHVSMPVPEDNADLAPAAMQWGGV